MLMEEIPAILFFLYSFVEKNLELSDFSLYNFKLSGIFPGIHLSERPQGIDPAALHIDIPLIYKYVFRSFPRFRDYNPIHDRNHCIHFLMLSAVGSRQE